MSTGECHLPDSSLKGIQLNTWLGVCVGGRGSCLPKARHFPLLAAPVSRVGAETGPLPQPLQGGVTVINAGDHPPGKDFPPLSPSPPGAGPWSRPRGQGLEGWVPDPLGRDVAEGTQGVSQGTGLGAGRPPGRRWRGGAVWHGNRFRESIPAEGTGRGSVGAETRPLRLLCVHTRVLKAGAPEQDTGGPRTRERRTACVCVTPCSHVGAAPFKLKQTVKSPTPSSFHLLAPSPSPAATN